MLLDEVLDVLEPREGQVYLDATAGLGGHAGAIAERLGSRGTVVLMDLDPSNLAHASETVRERVPDIELHAFHASYVEAPRRLASIHKPADIVLMDLGFASSQVDDPSRGLSFRHDGPLDMRLDPTRGMPASEFLATCTQDELGQIIRDYGEDRAWRRIARKLVETRDSAPIRTSGELARIVRDAIGPSGRSARIDPATRTFQALRIAINDELGHLEAMLGSIERADPSWLAPNARIAVISFHSLEDRPVKKTFASMKDRDKATLLTRKPITPTDEEIARNPRARSAKLRAIELARH